MTTTNERVAEILAKFGHTSQYNDGDRVYISAAGTAALIRLQLKGKFPGEKFSVRSHTYAGGASIDVDWTDGPNRADVEAIISRYAGGGFDGMIDMAYYQSHWLLPDGTAVLRHCAGTVGSRGTVPSYDGPAEIDEMPGALRVSFGANYVFAERTMSADMAARIAAATDDLEIGWARSSSLGCRDDAEFAHRVFWTPLDFPRTAWRAGLISATQAAEAAGYEVQKKVTA